MTEIALPQSHLHVVAKNPAEMERANKELIGWISQKIEREFAEAKDANENYQVAKKAKWRSAPWLRRTKKHKAKIIFYQKLRSALKAGYYIVPPFPVDIFAVRTDRKKPRGREVTPYAHNSGTALEQKPRQLPEGEGRYVAQEAENWRKDLSYKDSEGKNITQYEHFAKGFQEIDFPFKMAKPETLTATAQAMALKLFDQIGVLPKYMRRGDPIVVGQICHPELSREPMTFFISWWLDTGDL